MEPSQARGARAMPSHDRRVAPLPLCKDHAYPTTSHIPYTIIRQCHLEIPNEILISIRLSN